MTHQVVDHSHAEFTADVSPPTGWQDISSAPMDGTEILVFVPDDGQGVAFWIVEARSPRTGWCAGTDESGPLFLQTEPTHWMPLPAPPVSP